MRSSTSSPAATAWCTSPSSAAASASTPSRTCSTLGQEIEVRVDEIDDKGKVSLSPVGDAAARRPATPAPAAVGAGPERAPTAAAAATSSDVSFEESFDAELRDELGDLGPASDRGDERPATGRT